MTVSPTADPTQRHASAVDPAVQDKTIQCSAAGSEDAGEGGAAVACLFYLE